MNKTNEQKTPLFLWISLSGVEGRQYMRFLRSTKYMEFQVVLSARQANTAHTHSQAKSQCLWYDENLTRMEMILAPSAVSMLLFLKLREDKHTANDSTKASPRLAFIFFSLLDLGAGMGSPPPAHVPLHFPFT